MRSRIDAIHLFFIFDEYADRASLDEVWRYGNITLDAMRYPDKPRPKGEWVGGEVSRQYRVLSLDATQRTCGEGVARVGIVVEGGCLKYRLGLLQHPSQGSVVAGVTPLLFGLALFHLSSWVN